MARGMPDDTDPEVFRRQVAGWRTMTAGERALVFDRMCIDVAEIAVAGIRFAWPDASPEEVRNELARRRYGRRLADAAYTASPNEP